MFEGLLNVSAPKQGRHKVCRKNSRHRYVKYKSMWCVFWNISMILASVWLRNVRFRSSQEDTCASLFFNKVARRRPVTLFKKRLWHRCFSVNFAKFLGTRFLQKTSRWLLLKVRKFTNLFCLTTFSFNYFKSSASSFFLVFPVTCYLVICYLWYSNWFKNETFVTLEGNSEAYSEPCQTSKTEVFTKIVNAFSFFTNFAKSSILGVWQDSEFPRKPGKDLREKLHFRCLAGSWTHLCINYFHKLLPICLLNLINIFHYISSKTALCTVKQLLQLLECLSRYICDHNLTMKFQPDFLKYSGWTGLGIPSPNLPLPHQINWF